MLFAERTYPKDLVQLREVEMGIGGGEMREFYLRKEPADWTWEKQ